MSMAEWRIHYTLEPHVLARQGRAAELQNGRESSLESPVGKPVANFYSTYNPKPIAWLYLCFQRQILFVYTVMHQILLPALLVKHLFTKNVIRSGIG
jgi:hypothetical protein